MRAWSASECCSAISLFSSLLLSFNRLPSAAHSSSSACCSSTVVSIIASLDLYVLSFFMKSSVSNFSRSPRSFSASISESLSAHLASSLVALSFSAESSEYSFLISALCFSSTSSSSPSRSWRLAMSLDADASLMLVPFWFAKFAACSCARSDETVRCSSSCASAWHAFSIAFRKSATETFCKSASSLSCRSNRSISICCTLF
mmetsp:Transcript_3737/g.10529  ORF Transcript_3737/g.10529 Transcript_3737/m.10529 type:complete len:203 (+) Transcript_3737:492-1100(+)